VVQSGVTLEQILEPAFWSNVAPQIRVADTIDVHSDGRDFYAKLYVREVARARVSVSLIQHIEFDALADTGEAKTYTIRYDGPHSKFCLVRVSDGRVVKDGIETRDAAETALRAHEAAEARKVA
jgi:hypothetical protein